MRPRSLKSGYNFTLGAGRGFGGRSERRRGHGDHHGVAGDGRAADASARRARAAFAVNAGNTIWQNTTGAAPTEPFTASATVTPIQ